MSGPTLFPNYPNNCRRLLVQLTVITILGVAAILLLQSYELSKERQIRLAKERADVVAAIKTAGGSVSYQYQEDFRNADPFNADMRAPLPGPAESRKRYGIDYLSDVIYVGLFDTKLDHRDVAQLEILSSIRSMNLDGCQLTLETAAELAKLPELEWLSVSRTSLTDDEVRRLAEILPHVEISHPVFGASKDVIVGGENPPWCCPD